MAELKQQVVSLEEQVAQKDSAQNRDQEKVSDEAQSSREATLIRQSSRSSRFMQEDVEHQRWGSFVA